MCGIAGFFKKNIEDTFDPFSVLKDMSSVLKHRGPDQEGSFHCQRNNLYLAHQRLSIHDLSDMGRQPMTSHCERYVIVFNGEIYNYEEIRRDLESRSHRNWRGTSDTEVLLELFACKGIDKGLQEVDGMFSIALYDLSSNKLFLARDRFGEKPMYIYSNSNEFAFASELRAIEKFTSSLSLNHDAVAAQLSYSYIPAPHSIYNEVFKLTPGTFLSIDLNEFDFVHIDQAEVYWSALTCALQAKDCSQTKRVNVDDSIKHVERVLEKSVVDRMASDVSLGAFLSGGIDSTCIVSLMQKNSMKKVKTFSIGFEDESYNEAHHAKTVAQILGTEHHELYLKPQDMLSMVPKLVDVYDEPFSDSSQLPTLMVSRFAKSKVTVSLTGDSGDEMFGGYNRHLWANKLSKIFNKYPIELRKFISLLGQAPSPDMYNRLSCILNFISNGKLNYPAFGDKLYKLCNALRERDGHTLYNRLIKTSSSDFVSADHKEIATCTDKVFNLTNFSLPEKMMLQDTVGYMQNDILTKVDRASMSVSLETRVPFLSNDVFNAAWSIPMEHKIYNGNTKYPLRKIVSKYVPDEIMNRPKAGFGVPIYSWLRNELRDWAEYLLSEEQLKMSGILNVDTVRSSWKIHLSGKKNLQYDLWNVLMFQQWYLR